MSLIARRRHSRLALVAAAVLVAAGLTACGAGGGAGAQSAETVTWRHGILHPGSEAGFLLMAREKELFAKYGVDVEYVEFSSGAQIFPALIAGEVDSIEASPGALFPAVQKDADVRVVGSSMPGLPYAIYARQGIESVADLKGKTLAISAPNALPAEVAKAVLAEAGLGFDDVQYVNAGSNADRYRAVVAGAADAASSPADFVPQAEKDGVNVLALSTDVVPKFPRYTVTASGKSLEERPQGMVRFLAALSEGIQYAVDHPDEAAELTAETLGTTPDDPMVTYMTDLILEKELVAPDVRVPTEQIEYLQDLLIELGELDGPVELDAMLDDSYREEALTLVESQAS